MPLINCLDKITFDLNEQEYILKKSKALEATGLTQKEAELAAVKELQQDLIKNLQDVYNQLEISTTKEVKSTDSSKGRGVVKPAQVLLPWRFKANIKDYIDENGIIDTSKISPELLEQFGFRIPNQGHNSMALIEVVGFLPQGSNHIVASRNFITQMGSDFDVDKLFLYDYFTIVENGIIKKDWIDNVNSIKNDILDIHKSVVSNEKIFNQVTTPLENVKDTETAIYLKKINKKKINNYLSPDYDKNKYLESVDGKAMVSINALANTLNGIIQGHNLSFQTQDGDTNQIIFGDEKGKKIALSNLSNPLTWKGRLKSNVISADLSAAVDNEKNPILSTLNNNPITAPALIAFRQVGFEEDHYDMLFAQPIIRNFTSIVRRNKSTVNRRGRGVERAVMAMLKMEAREAYLKTLTEDQQKNYKDSHLLYYPLTIKQMKENLNKQTEVINLTAILKFEQAYDLGESLQEIQRAVNIESKGVGKSILELSLKAENVNRLFKIKNIANVSKVLGEFTDAGFKDTTYTGSIIKRGLFEANTVLGTPSKNDLFKYNSRSFKEVLKDYEKVNGNFSNVEQTEALWNAFRSYIFARNFSTEERKALFIGKDNLALRIKRFLKTKEGRVNPFLIRLTFDTKGGLTKPNYVFYDAAKEEYIEEVGIYQGLISLVTSNDETTRKLGEDLVSYFYINGGIQGAKQWGKYIHPGYLKSFKQGSFLNSLRGIDFENPQTAGSDNGGMITDFAIQYFQHNPYLLPEVNIKSEAVNESTSKEKISLEMNAQEKPLILDKNGEYPNMFSVKSSDGDRGYKVYLKEYQDTEKAIYTRINVLGDKNFLEYSSDSRATSLINKKYKPVKAVISAVKNKPTSDTKSIPTRAWYEGNINEILDKISKGYPKHGLLIELLKTKKYTGVVNLNSQLVNGGSYNHDTKNISVNPNIAGSVERVLLHEILHAATADTLNSNEGLTANQIKAAESLRSIASILRARVISGELEYAGLKASELLEFDSLLAKQRQNTNTDEEKKRFFELRPIYYGIRAGTEQVHEFVAELFTMPQFQVALNKIKYDGKTTLLDRLIELITKLLNTFGAKEGSLLEASIKEAVILIGDQQETKRKVTLDLSRKDLPPGLMSYEIINENTTNEYKEFIAQYQTRLKIIDQAISVAYQTDNQTEIQRLQNRKEEVEDELKQIEDSLVLGTILSIGDKDLDKIDAILASPTVSINDLNYTLRVITMWRESKEFLLDSSDTKDRNQRYKDVKKLESKADDSYDLWSDIARLSLLKAVKAESGLEHLTLEAIEAQNRITAITANMMDISRSGNIILDVMSKWMREATLKTNLEANEIHDQTEKIIKGLETNNNFKKNGYYEFAQRDNNGNLTGELIQPLNAEYFQNRNLLIEETTNTTSKVKKNQKWKEYFDWVRQNHNFVDLRKLYNIDEKGFYKYKANEEYLTILKKTFGDRYEDIIEEQKQKIEFYNERLKAKIQSLDPDDPNTFRQINKYKAKYDPSIYLRNVLSNEYSSNTIDGEYIKNEGHEFVVKRANKKWEDIQFNKIQDSPELKAFYDHAITTLNRLYSYLPPSFKEGVTTATIPNIPKTVIETFTEKGLNAALTEANNNLIRSISTTELEVQSKKLKDPVTKKPEQSLSVRYLSDLTSIEKSYDLGKVINVFALEALAFKHKSQVEDQIKLAYSILEQSLETVKSPSGRNMIDRFGKTLTVKDSKNLKEQVEYAVRVFYGDRKNLQGETSKKVYLNKAKTKYKAMLVEIEKIEDKDQRLQAKKEADVFLNENTRYVVGSKIGDQILKYMQLKGMGWNIFGSVTNLTFGWISNFIHSFGNVDFNTSQLMQANRIMLAATANGVGWSSDMSRKINALMTRYDVLKELNNAAYDATTGANRARKGMENLSPFELQRKGEYFVQGMTLVASMLNTKVTVNGESMTLWDAYDTNGNFKETTNINWNGDINKKETNKEFYKFKFKLDQVNKAIHGNYDPNSPVRIKSGFMGRAVMQFRSWVAEGVANRFEDRKYDMFLGRERQGRWRSYIDLGFKDSMKVLVRLAAGQKIDDIVKQDELALVTENMRRNLGELYVKLSLLALYLILQGIDLDDEDDYQKKARNLLLNQILRNQDDIEFYYSPLAVENITQNFIPVFNVAKDAAKFIDALEKGIISGDWDYKTGKKAKQNRLLWTGAKLLPGGSSMASFINKSENEESFRK